MPYMSHYMSDIRGYGENTSNSLKV